MSGGTPRNAGESRRDAMAELLSRPLSQRDLAEQTRAAAMPLERESARLESVLLVEVGGERMGLPAALVRRVFPLAPVHRVPHRTNRVLRGICNLGGRLTLAASLEALLDLAAEATADARQRRTLLIGEESAAWAIEVDRVLGVIRINTETLATPPATVEAARERHTARLLDDPTPGGGRIALLDGERLLASLARSLA
jgi:chemotaxis-related protein WspD